MSEEQAESTSPIPTYLAGYGSSMFKAPVPLAGAEVDARKSQVVDLMSEAAELSEEAESLRTQCTAVTKVLNTKQGDARRMAHEIKFKVRTEDVDCVRVPLVEESLVALRRPDKKGLPLVALYELGEAEAEESTQLKLSAKAQKFSEKTAEMVAALDDVGRAKLYRG